MSAALSPRAPRPLKPRLTPRQAEFIRRYALRKSPTFGNAYQSALASGFSEGTSQSIMSHLAEKAKLSLAEALERSGLTKSKLATKLHEVIDESGRDRVPALRLASQVMGDLQVAPQVTVNLFQHLGISDQSQAERMLREHQAASRLTPREQFEAACQVVDAWCRRNGESVQFPALAHEPASSAMALPSPQEAS